MRLLALLALSLPLWISAQVKQGQIIFKEISSFEIPEQYRQYIPEDMPDSLVSETILVFNEKKSLYAPYENLDAEVPAEPSRFQQMMSYWRGDDNQFYRDLELNRQVEKRGFMGKPFIIEGPINDTTKWKIVPTTDKILGYNCMMATTEQDSTAEVKVWFTTEIPQPFGPMTLGGLPGMVLKMELKSDKFGMKVIADSIEERKVKKKEFKEPKGGKTVTQEEFQAIVKEKTEEMQQNGRGGWGK